MADNLGRLYKPSDSNGEENNDDAGVAHDGKHINVQFFPLATYILALN